MSCLSQCCLADMHWSSRLLQETTSQMVAMMEDAGEGTSTQSKSPTEIPLGWVWDWDPNFQLSQEEDKTLTQLQQQVAVSDGVLQDPCWASHYPWVTEARCC